MLGRHKRERIFILTLLIRKELNLSGNRRSFFSFRHTIKSILRSDCKSCKISLSFQGSFLLIYNQGQEKSHNSGNPSPCSSRWESNFLATKTALAKLSQVLEGVNSQSRWDPWLPNLVYEWFWYSLKWQTDRVRHRQPLPTHQLSSPEMLWTILIL